MVFWVPSPPTLTIVSCQSRIPGAMGRLCFFLCHGWGTECCYLLTVLQQKVSVELFDKYLGIGASPYQTVSVWEREDELGVHPALRTFVIYQDRR